jgi:hypothetical protein
MRGKRMYPRVAYCCLFRRRRTQKIASAARMSRVREPAAAAIRPVLPGEDVAADGEGLGPVRAVGSAVGLADAPADALVSGEALGVDAVAGVAVAAR